MSGPELTVGRGVIAELVRLAAFEVRASPGSGGAARRGDGSWADRPFPCRFATIASSSGCGSWPVRARPLGPLAAQVRSAVAATVERLLGLDLGAVTVLVDGVGG